MLLTALTADKEQEVSSAIFDEQSIGRVGLGPLSSPEPSVFYILHMRTPWIVCVVSYPYFGPYNTSKMR